MMFYNRLLECICPQTTKPTRQGRRSWKHVKRLGRWGGGRKSYNVWRASVSRGHKKNGRRRVRKVSNVCRPVMSGFFNRTSCDPSGAPFHVVVRVVNGQNVVFWVISAVDVPPDDSWISQAFEKLQRSFFDGKQTFLITRKLVEVIMQFCINFKTFT